MATIRGFVYRIEVGRAGLVTVSLMHDDASTANYIIRDLDADPERFNERLSKLAILRDAMDRAEPVEIEHSPAEGGNEIQRAVRITRDELVALTGTLQEVTGLVLDVQVNTSNVTGANEEKGDTALITVVASDLAPRMLILDLQNPERGVAQQMLTMVLDAQTHGRLIRCTCLPVATALLRILTLGVDNSPTAFGGERVKEIDGFVESLSLIKLPAFSGSPYASSLAHVRFTLAPAFTGPGNTVGLKVFNPITVDLLTPKGSLAYQLFEAGLRDNLRMRVSAAVLDIGRDQPKPNDTGAAAETTNTNTMDYAVPRHNMLARALMTNVAKPTDASMLDQANTKQQRIGIALACELLAPLASASRPVWITIARTSLDHGTEGFQCTKGVPTSDLRPKGLRDLRIPYPAVWTGLGCFNKGVYRFQICLPVCFKLFVDGEELCLHDAEDGIAYKPAAAEVGAKVISHVGMTEMPDVGGTTQEPAGEGTGTTKPPKVHCKLAHACLCGEHEVRVEIEDWTCDYQFIMDVYRIR